MTDRLARHDFAAHNAETQRCWDAFNAGQPYRTPVVLGLAPRYFIYNAAVNTDRLTFREYSENLDAMFDFQLRWQRWSRFNILQDTALGLPEKWTVDPDFQNYHEAAWFGCEVVQLDNQAPDTTPAFADCPERLLERGLFVLREGNNLAPGTPLENTEALYHAGREFGKIT